MVKLDRKGTLIDTRRCADMSEVRRELYRSSNGDIWFLIRDDSGRVHVEHQPNAASGGKGERLDVAVFLATGPEGPQHQALLSLIGGLVDHQTVEPTSIPRRP